MNLHEIKEITDSLGISGFSLFNSGFELLVYITGWKNIKTPAGPPENFVALGNSIREKYGNVGEDSW
jgi:hypothetical protein